MNENLRYRREDTSATAGRLSDRLASHFGAESVIKDMEVIPVGTDFRETIEAEVQQCDVLLALIGQQWIRATDDTGQRHLDNPNDFVRVEIETALEREVLVVPVIVEGALMPSEKDLPAPIASLAYHNAAELRSDPDFHRDSDRLIKALEGLIESFSTVQRGRQEEIPDLDLGESGKTVFVSHSTRDRKWVDKQIVRLLEIHGFKPWYSKESIKTAAQWEREILRGLESCEWFLLVVSPRAAESEWIKDELNWAIYHRPTRIAPVIMESCDFWDFHIRLPRIQHIDFTHDVRDAQQDLVKVLVDAA